MPDPNRANLLWQMVLDVFAGRYQHVFKVFIKREPHTKAKASEGRWRMIMASSLPVQVAWHMTIGHQENKFLKTYKNPLMHSLVYFGGGWKLFNRFSQQHGLEWCADKSGWDWNSPHWVYKLCKELRLRLENNATDEWVRVLDLLYSDSYEQSKVILSTGTVLQQEDPGLMKSGTVPTISDNGIAQVALHVLAERRLRAKPTMLVATGDDTFQQKPADPESYVYTLQRAGCIVKEYGEGRDFMGFEISSNGIRPKYLTKHLINLKMQRREFLAETLEGYLRIYAHCREHFDFFRNIAKRMGISVPSRQYFHYFMDNPEALEPYYVQRPSFADRVVSVGVVD